MTSLFEKIIVEKRSLPLPAQGESMLPLLKDGDCVCLKPTPFSRIKVNDIVIFGKFGRIICHRVIYKRKNYLITKGDNLLRSDGKIYRILGKADYIVRKRKFFSLETAYLIQSTLYFQEILKIKKAFEKEKINYVFLKGLPLHLYLEKTQPKRIYADCDVLIEKKDLKKAVKILEDFKYQKAKTSLPFSFQKVKKNPFVEETYFKLINGITVAFDLHLKVVFMMTKIPHLDLFYPQAFVDQITDDFLKNKKPITLENEKFFILDLEFLVVYLALHLFHHNFRGAFRYQLLDKLIKKRKINWKKVSFIIKKYKLTNFVFPVFYFLKKYYQTPLPKKFLSFKQKKYLLNFFKHLNIFDEQSRIEAGANRFFLLFLLSPSPFLKKIFVFFNSQIIFAIFFVFNHALKLKLKKIDPLSYLERLFALILLIFFLPLFLILFFLVKIDSFGPFIFKQKRLGKNKKPFIIYKIRTMTLNAEKQQKKVKNQADGPVFKNYDDPRFSKIGKIISRFGLDELPQLVNILKGEMSFVGPRPLPLIEAEKIPRQYEKRFSIKPGIFSSWVANGAFHHDFNRWMMLDLEDVEKKSFFYDLKIFLRSVGFVIKLILCSKSKKG